MTSWVHPPEPFKTIAALRTEAVEARKEAEMLRDVLREVEANVSSNENKPTSVLANIGRICRAALVRTEPKP